ncbi:COG4223 family protein [Woodsholea maritima]|uniref:COG4223 family protein n=1 Tax=Woodsholea maritima TaxID=240237 RepID=UPI00037522B4|nr:hypothetical protein [Woodsholea maritima]
MSASSSPPPGEPEPVDAEFEPAAPDGAPDQPRPETPVKPIKAGLGLGGALSVIVLSGLVSGAVAYAVISFMPSAGPASDAPDLSAFERRIAALETSPQPSGFDPSPLEERLGALEADQARMTALTDRLDSLEASLETGGIPTSEAGAVSAPEGYAQLTQDVADLRARLDQNEAADAQLLSQIQALATATPQDAANTDDQAAFSRQLADLSDRLTIIREDLERQAQALDALSAGQSAPFDPSGLEAALASLSERLDETDGRLGQLSQSSQSADLQTLSARALALSALGDAASRATPFEAERAALARVWRGQEDVIALEGPARSGVPTLNDLARQFPGNEIRSAAGTGALLFGLIKTRPSEDQAGEGPAALTTQAERRLAANDLAGAIGLVERLEGEPAQAAQAWLIAARERQRVNAHLDRLRTDLTALSASQGVDPT